MQELNLPKYEFRIQRDSEQRLVIFDSLRRKNLVLTPEEWVRQHIIRFLIEEKGYPGSLISLEAGLKVNRLARRYDALVYSRQGSPIMLVECKAPEVAISQKTFDQIVHYNLQVKADYLLVTNGLKHYCCRLKPDGSGYLFLQDIPVFTDLKA